MRLKTLAVAVMSLCFAAACSRTETPPAQAPAEQGLIGLATGGLDKVAQCMTVQAATLQATIGLLGLAATDNDAAATAESLRNAAELVEQMPQDPAVRDAWRGIVAALPSVQGKGMEAANRLADSPDYKRHIETMGRWYKAHCDHSRAGDAPAASDR